MSDSPSVDEYVRRHMHTAVQSTVVLPAFVLMAREGGERRLRLRRAAGAASATLVLALVTAGAVQRTTQGRSEPGWNGPTESAAGSSGPSETDHDPMHLTAAALPSRVGRWTPTAIKERESDSYASCLSRVDDVPRGLSWEGKVGVWDSGSFITSDASAPVGEARAISWQLRDAATAAEQNLSMVTALSTCLPGASVAIGADALLLSARNGRSQALVFSHGLWGGLLILDVTAPTRPLDRSEAQVLSGELARHLGLPTPVAGASVSAP